MDVSFPSVVVLHRSLLRPSTAFLRDRLPANELRRWRPKVHRLHAEMKYVAGLADAFVSSSDSAPLEANFHLLMVE
jgi:hypothetical protein